MNRIEHEKIAKTIVATIKKSFAERKKEEGFKTTSIDIEVWDNNKGYKITNGYQYKVFADVEGLTASDVEGIGKALMNELNTLKVTKGWGGLSYETTKECKSVSRWWDEGVTFPSRVDLMAEPCKEFKSLVNYLDKYSNVKLKTENVYRVNIGGKRGYVYGEEGNRRYLCHRPKACEDFLAELRKARGTNDSVFGAWKSHDDIDPMDLQHSRYYETEFSGVRECGYEITIKTPMGKVKKVLMVA